MREIVLWLLVAVSIPAVLKRPLLGVTIYLGANIVRPEMLFWGGERGSFVFSVYYGLILLACLLQGRLARIGEIWRAEYLLMLWLLAAIAISSHYAQFQAELADYFALEMAKSFGICAILYLLITQPADIERLQTALLGCLTFLGLWGIQQQMLGNERLEGLGGSAWGDSNGVASVYVLFFPVALAKLYDSRKRSDFWIFLGVTSVMAALIVCTKSRGGLLGLVTALVSFGFYARRMTQVVKVALLVLLLVAPFATESYLERMKSMDVNSSDELEGSARSRLILWQAGLMVFSEHPLTGTGFLTYPEAKMKFEPEFSSLEEGFRSWVFRTESKKVTHNTYIQMLSDCGLLGAIPFILLVLGGILKGLRARARISQGGAQSRELLLLCGLSAGLTGFSVCIITIDSVTLGLLYCQLVLIGILYRITAATPAKEHAGAAIP